MAAEITVRRFQSSDADAVARLWDAALPASRPWNDPRRVICRKLHADDGLFFVGERDGEVIATVLAGHDGVRGWIYAMAVAEEHRRGGVGRRMLEEAERALFARGCDKINLQVRGNNRDVIAFYERCGFAVEDRASLGKPLAVERDAVTEPVPTIPVNGRITLSQITWGDKASYVKHLNETETFHANMGLMPFPYMELDADQWISKVLRETLETDRRRNWAIRNEQGLIGGAGVFGLTRGERAEIGYWLARPYWGQGIATQVVRQLCEFAFAEYELQRVFAQVFAGNRASARVLEKAGFQREGTLRSHYFKDGKPVDVTVFGTLRPA